MWIEGAVLRGLTDLGIAGRWSLQGLIHHRAVVVPMAAAACGKAGFRIRRGRLNQRCGVETSDDRQQEYRQ